MIEYRSDVIQSMWQSGVDYLLAGALPQAARFFKILLAIQPDHLDAQHLLAVAYYQEDRGDDAVPLFRRVTQAHPQKIAYHTNFAATLLEVGQPVAALCATFIAIILDPADPDALINHASSLRACDMAAAAVPYARRAIARRPSSSAAYSVLGQALSQQNLFAEMIPPLQAGIVLDPTAPRAYYALGQGRNALGLPGAESALICALRLRPGQPQYLATLAAAHKFTPGDEWLDQLQAAEAGRKGPDGERIEDVGLLFALSKALTDIGKEDDGFSYLLKANAAKRQRVNYQETVTLPMFETAREVFSPALIQRKSGGGHPSMVPIFIVGLPRSGTTLIEQVLASHSHVHGGGELSFFGHLVDTLDPDRRISYPLTVPHVTLDKLREVGAAYVGELRSAFGNQRRVTDKMPGNLAFAGLIHLALPNAKIIQVRRDLTDVCLSCFSINFINGLDFTYDLSELGHYAYSAKRFMDHWEKLLPADRLLTVQYEDFIEDQEGQTRRLLEFCDLPWEESCLSFYDTERSVKTASVLQVRKPIYKSSVGRWRPAPEILQPLTDALEGKGAVPAGAASFWFDILVEGALGERDWMKVRRLSAIASANAPDSATAWHSRGLALHLSGDNREAAKCLARAVPLMPDNAHCRNNFGTVRRELGDLDRAQREYRTALCLLPDYADLLYNLGNMERQLGNLHAAESLHRRSLRLQPATVESWNELGAALVDLGRVEEARQAFLTAIRLFPLLASAHFRLACAFDIEGDIGAMLSSLRKVLVCDPAFYQALIFLGTERSEVGDNEAAERLLRRALTINPDSAEAWYNLALTIRITEESPDLQEILRLARTVFAHQPVKSKILMHFTLAKVFGDMGDHRRAFYEADAGNRLKRGLFDYDVADDEATMQRVARVFSAGNFSCWSCSPAKTDMAPIFIVGMPRSGSSLVEQILAALPGTAAGGELLALEKAVQAAGQIFGPYPDILDNDETRVAYLSSVGTLYEAATSEIASGADRLLDKLPENFLFSGLILLAFPKAKIVHCRRDPLDVCWSCYSNNFTIGHEYCCDLLELGRYYRAYDDLSEHWRTILPRDRYYEISYEALVSDPVGETRALAAFCRLTWDESCLDFHRQGRRTRTASQQQVRLPIYRTAVGKWRPYSPYLQPLIETLGLQS